MKSKDGGKSNRSNRGKNQDLGNVGPFGPGPSESPHFKLPHSDVKQSINTNFLPDLEGRHRSQGMMGESPDFNQSHDPMMLSMLQ